MRLLSILFASISYAVAITQEYYIMLIATLFIIWLSVIINNCSLTLEVENEKL